MTEQPHHRDLDEAPPSADEALALIREQQRAVERNQLGGIPWILGVWALAWGVGFFALWSGYGGNPWFSIPLGVAGTLFGALIVSAIVVSAIVGARIGRGVHGQSAFSGAVYGVSWAVGSGVIFAIGMALSRAGAEADVMSLYYPAGYSLVAGLIYLMGAALWRSIDQLVLGIIIAVVGAIAPFFGAPTNNLVMAVLGGGAFLVAAIVMQLSLGKAAR